MVTFKGSNAAQVKAVLVHSHPCLPYQYQHQWQGRVLIRVEYVVFQEMVFVESVFCHHQDFIWDYLVGCHVVLCPHFLLVTLDFQSVLENGHWVVYFQLISELM